MSNISLTFVAHQPNRLIHYDFFKIGEHAFYEDDDLNARVLSTVAERCYCFGCGAGGNVYTFIQEYENYTFPEAVKMLADRAGVNLPEIEYSEEAKKAESKRSRLLEINKEAAKYFYFQLRARQGETEIRNKEEEGILK